jgi:hypothetical protein
LKERPSSGGNLRRVLGGGKPRPRERSVWSWEVQPWRGWKEGTGGGGSARKSEKGKALPGGIRRTDGGARGYSVPLDR